LCRAGAEIIVNLSASNEVLGKADWRRTLVASQSGRLACGYVYVSAGVGESSADVVFGGDAFIAENGAVLAEGRRFARDGQLVVADLDLGSLRHDRRRSTTFQAGRIADAPVEHRPVAVTPAEPSAADLRRPIDRHPFVPDDEEQRRARCEEIIEVCAHGLLTAMEGARCERLVLGLSGGLDSTLAAITSVRALDLAGLDRSNLTCLVMPGAASSDRTQSNAERLGRELRATTKVVPIGSLSADALSAIGHDGSTEDVTYENTQARMRTLLLMNTANQVGGLVVGTGDLSELALGWCTFNGDHMSMYNVNVGIPKTLVRHVVSTAAAWQEFADVSLLLHDIVDTPVSPELTGDGSLEQRTEDIVGPYELADFFLYRLIRHGDAPAKIAYLAGVAFDTRYDDETIAHWLSEFLRRFTNSQFKRDALPTGPKVGTVALSPRGDWRMSPQTGRWY
jgi:NAD+ synthase (glutamine-hydrolysing)